MKRIGIKIDKKIVLPIVIIFILLLTVFITSYGFFSYVKNSQTENVIKMGSLTFKYTENENLGNGISMIDSNPISDSVGKQLSKEGQIFDFKIEANLLSDDLEYEVVAEILEGSNLPLDVIKLYLTEVTDEGEIETANSINADGNVKTLSEYNDTELINATGKTIYQETITKNTKNYLKQFRVRMWIDENIDLTNTEYSNTSGSIKINVYANGDKKNYQAYSIGEAVTLTDGSKWHVLENSSETNPNVVLLSDYNLNSDGTYNTTCGRDINSTYTCSTIVFDSNSTNKYDESDSNNIGYFIKNTYAPLVVKSLPGTTNVTLPTATQIATADGQVFNQEILYLSNSWLLTTNYWTSTARNSSTTAVWYVGSANFVLNMGGNAANTNYGVRPTITVPKEYIVETLDSTNSLSIGDAVTATDGSKWHVLEASESGTETVVLLSDYNLNSDGTYNTTCGRDINSTYYCSNMAFDTDNTNVYNESDSNNIGYFIKNIYAPKVATALPQTTDITLPSASQIATADEQIFSQTSNLYLTTDSWLATTSYWTITSTVYDVYTWVVSGPDLHLGISDTNLNNMFGARPTITTLKTNLLAN